MWDTSPWAGQRGSFIEPVAPPDVEPDASPLVCLSINADWLPYVVGAAMQLAQPSTWATTDAGLLQTTLFRAMALIDQIGQAGACEGPAMQLRVNNCQLQASTDGGTTWAEIAGWSDYQASCLPLVSLKVTEECQLAFTVDGGETWQGVANWDTYQAMCLPKVIQTRFTSDCQLETSSDGGTTWVAVPGWVDNLPACFAGWLTAAGGVTIPSVPVNPGNLSADNEACAIATYLANAVIKQSLTQAITSIEGNLGKAGLLLGLVQFIPGVDIITDLMAFGAFGLYSAINGGTIGNYQAAVADSSLWSTMSCAIYEQIKAVGYVDATNYDAVLTAIAAVTYTHSEVVTTIHDYAASLGLSGVRQLQSSGALDTGDCSGCGGAWCYTFDFTTGDLGWAISGNPDYAGAYSTGVGFIGTENNDAQISLQMVRSLEANMHLTFFSIYYTVGHSGELYLARSWAGGFPGGTDTIIFEDHNLAGGNLLHSAPGLDRTVDALDVIMYGSRNDLSDTITVTKIVLEGTGTCPFGTPNC